MKGAGEKPFTKTGYVCFVGILAAALFVYLGRYSGLQGVNLLFFPALGILLSVLVPLAYLALRKKAAQEADAG